MQSPVHSRNPLAAAVMKDNRLRT